MIKPMGHYADKSDVNGLINWERKMQFVKCEPCPIIHIKRTLQNNRRSKFTKAEYDNSYGEVMYEANDLFKGFDRHRILDHWDLYTTKDGKKYFVLNPYCEPWHDDYYNIVSHVTRWCNENDIDLEIRTHGFYYPPATMFILSYNPEYHDKDQNYNKHQKWSKSYGMW